ncbi:MAG: pyridoxal-dependent decarboxylase [Bacteroidota bacterium]
MNQSLDLSPEAFEQLLARSSELILDHFQDMEKKKAYHSYPHKEVASWFDEPLPMEGMDIATLLELTKEKVMDPSTYNLGPNMYAYVMAGGTQVSIVAEQLAATINNNMGKWHLAPTLNEIERRVIQWGGEITAFGKEAAGIMVSGGSAANLAGLTIARNLFFEKQEVRKKGLFGMRPFTIYTSVEVHGCVDKSIEELGIGTDYLRKIEVNDNATINLEKLEQKIEEDIGAGFTPFCLVGNAGTVNTGAIDDLTALAQLAKKYGMWYHIDGAYGGLLGSLPSVKKEYQGIELADSLAVDFHKWMYQPFEAGCVLVRDWDILRRAYFKKASYLDARLEESGRINFNEHSFQLSKNAKGFKVWMSLKAYGLKKLQEMMQKDIDLAHFLADQVAAHPDFELKSRSRLAIACFRYVKGCETEEAIEDLNRRLIPALEKDGRVFITGTIFQGQFVIRACLINHRMHKGTVNHLVHVIQEVASNINVTALEY